MNKLIKMVKTQDFSLVLLLFCFFFNIDNNHIYIIFLSVFIILFLVVVRDWEIEVTTDLSENGNYFRMTSHHTTEWLLTADDVQRAGFFWKFINIIDIKNVNIKDIMRQNNTWSNLVIVNWFMFHLEEKKKE